MDQQNDDATEANLPPLASDNPWYMLMTLYGECEGSIDDAANKEVGKKNRIAWNRLMASCLEGENKAFLQGRSSYTRGEFEPLSSGEFAKLRLSMEKRGISKTFYDNLRITKTHESKMDLTGCKFQKLLDCRGYYFPTWVYFDRCDFERDAYFHDCFCEIYASFKQCKFQERAKFSRSRMTHWGQFQNSVFVGSAEFDHAIFDDGVDFTDSLFESYAVFNHAVLEDSATFRRVRFAARAIFYAAKLGYASFQKAQFDDGVDFDRAQFLSPCDFQQSKYGSLGTAGMNWHYRHPNDEDDHPHSGPHGASFRHVSFAHRVDFENAEFSSSLSFRNASFNFRPPIFFGASLHQGAEWRGASWPLPKDGKEAGSFIDAYACLKLEMDRLNKHEDELDFFALELKSRKAMLGRWKGFSIGLYGWLCDFGRSYIRPLIGILATVVGFMFPFWIWFGDGRALEAVGLSAANTFAFLGFRKEFIATGLLSELPANLQFIAGLQTVLGATFVFLFILALRNKFRMK